MSKLILSQEYVKYLFTYDGLNLRWRVKKSMRIKLGEVAGSLNGEGYIHIEIDGKKHKAHRLIWLYVYGEMPPDEIDHINRNKLDNSIDNLRLADRQINSRNRGASKNSKTGIRGVYLDKNYGRWVASINTSKNTRLRLGYFDTLYEAISARLGAEALYY